MDYRDAGHRPHAVHTGETPKNEWDRGPYGITVTLDTWGPQENLFTSIYDALQSNWGEHPSRSKNQPNRPEYDRHYDHWIPSKGYIGPLGTSEREMNIATGWARLTDDQRDYVESCFNGKTLPQILELLSFEFTIDGCTRACTHQLVRTRIGAAFMQHGGRDNDWRHRRWTMPETIHRAMDFIDNTDSHSEIAEQGLSHCLTNAAAIEVYLDEQSNGERDTTTLGIEISKYLESGRRLYSALVDAGIPWQDARRVLWMGTQTYIHAVYNFLALQGVCNKRLEFAMDWEINAVAQLMVREVRMKCPPLIGKYLQSLSDKLGVAAFAGLESWTPDGKHPVPADKQNLPRTHRPEQAPFWVLHPDSMAGGPVQWIPTNGTFPTEY